MCDPAPKSRQMQERGLAELEGTRPGRDAKNPEMNQLLDMGDPTALHTSGPPPGSDEPAMAPTCTEVYQGPRALPTVHRTRAAPQIKASDLGQRDNAGMWGFRWGLEWDTCLPNPRSGNQGD